MAEYSKPASKFVGSKIHKMMKEGMPQNQAVAASLNVARKKGMKVPPKKEK